MPLAELLGGALGAEYTVEREIHGGGMSRVLVAYDRQLDRRVVVKLLPPELAATVSLERFRREILVSAGLQHPNIVPVLQAGEANGLPYLVMPYVEGASLRARLADGPLRVVETVSILRDVARALAFAHARGVVHRDIKPDNVLLSSGAAVVADFGVAKALSTARRESGPSGAAHPRGTITAAGTSLGTPDYMAPEQIAADPGADHRVDLYALGVMAYEMLTGATPFHDRPPQSLLAAHLTEAPVPVGELRPGLPVALCNLVMRCLAKAPDDRPSDASAILAALDDPAVVSGAFTSTGAMVTARSQLARPWWRRSATMLAAAVIVLALLSGGLLMRQLGDPGTNAAPSALASVAAIAPSGATAATPAAALGGAAGPSAIVVPSLAVLPLTYVGADTSGDYLARGLTSELTSAVGQVTGLRVLSQGAAEQLQRRISRGDDVTGAVGMYLEGVVQREGDDLRIDARIVNAADGFMLWADSYQGTVADRFALQQAMGEAVAAAVRRAVQ